MVAHKDSLVLVITLLPHPQAKELVHMASQLLQDAQKTQTPPERGLVATALNLAKRQGIKDPPYFKGMANDKIRKWIDRHSPKPEIT